MLIYKVENVRCQRCANRVTKAILGAASSATVWIDRRAARVKATGIFDPAGIAAAIHAAGHAGCAPTG